MDEKTLTQWEYESPDAGPVWEERVDALTAEVRRLRELLERSRVREEEALNMVMRASAAGAARMRDRCAKAARNVVTPDALRTANAEYVKALVHVSDFILALPDEP